MPREIWSIPKPEVRVGNDHDLVIDILALADITPVQPKARLLRQKLGKNAQEGFEAEYAHGNGGHEQGHILDHRRLDHR